MAHISIEYSANLEDAVDIAGLCDCLRHAAATHQAFEMAGIRVRAFPARHFAIADGNPEHAFVDIHVRLREGRAPDLKKNATDALFAAAKGFLDPTLATRSLALSLEMRDITADYAPKTGTIRQYLKDIS